MGVRVSWGGVRCLGIATVAAFAVATPSASAATLPVPCGNVAALRAAITTANATTTPDTIDVTGAPCNFDIPNAAIVQAGGDSGLPVVTRPLTIEGHGATLRRTGATNYRILLASTPDFVTVPRVELRELTIAGGRLVGATENGAGIAGFFADFVLDRVVLASNQTAGRGGAASILGGSIDADRSVFAFNIAAFGGALYSSTNTTSNDIMRSSMYLNSVTGNSGAILLENGAASIENSTIAANSAPNGAGGVTAFTSAAGTPASVSLRSSTFTDNGIAASTAPGTSLASVAGAGTATITATDTIVSDSDSTAAAVSAPCLTVGGTIDSTGGNVEWPTTTCGFETEADPRVAVQFGGLGGFELFAKLLRDSAAIDGGGGDCPAIDQRGQPRPGGLACDSGSYETHPPQTTANGPSSPTNDPQVTFNSDEPGSTFECTVDGTDWEACTSPFAPALGDGSHTVDVRAIDPDGDVDPTPASVTFVVDATDPEVAIDPVASPTTSPSTEITFTVTDASEISSLTCQVDEEPEVACSSPFSTGDLAEGEHTVTVRATDAAGNNGSDSVTFVFDRAPETIPGRCDRRTVLLGSECTVTFTCPAANSGCEAAGFAEVAARPTGIVHGAIAITTPTAGAPERTSRAECGFPVKINSRCRADAQTVAVDPGDNVSVACAANRRPPAISLITTDLYCVATLTTNVG